MTATRSPRGSLEKLTLSGAPIPRTTSHSVWPSATDVADGATPLLVWALAVAGTPDGAMPAQAPSALTRSSGLIGLVGVSGGVSIETFLMKSLPPRENHSASFDNRSDENISDVPEQPEIIGTNSRSAS